MAPPLVLAIDGNSLVHRSYHSQAHTAAVTEGARPSWAVRGLLTQIVAAVDRIQPTCVVVGFDDPHSSLRRERWPSYKAHRGEKLETLVAQLASAVQVLRDMGIAVIVPPGLEADDVLASTAEFTASAGGTTVIVTSDRDSFSLIDEQTSVLRIINGGVEASPMLTPERLKVLLGIRPSQYRDFAALRGDPSDNLPGVRGIGPRTATHLLTEFGTAAAAFDDLEAVRDKLGPGVAKRLAEPDARRAWALNCQVMAMRRDIRLELNLDHGPGVLPLPAEAVREAFRMHNLTWSLSEGLRVLADVAPASPQPPRTIATPWADNWSVDGAAGHARGGWGEHRRAARSRVKVPPSRPKVEQLSLFD